MGAMQAILQQMDYPTAPTQQPLNNRYIVSPRHWALQVAQQQRRQPQVKPQHKRVQQLRSCVRQPY